MNRGFSSNIQSMGDADEPDLIYYNASIVNNETNDTSENNQAIKDPPIRFNETRDKAIINDASKYKFSIIRFAVNGGGLDLPLFIPQIQVGTGQTNPNLTVYGLGLTYSGLDVDAVINGSAPTGITPGLLYVNYIPETQNKTLAPLPRSPANANFVGDWDSATTYVAGNIVLYLDVYYQAQAVYDLTVVPNVLQTNLNKVPDTAIYQGQAFWLPVSAELGNPQDISSRYYWISTYTYWLQLVQNTLELANATLYDNYVIAGGALFATYTAWKLVYPTPVISYNPDDGLFSIDFPPTYLSLADQTAQGYVNPVAGSKAVISLYMNANMYGLFANFKATYFNSPDPLVPYPGSLINPVNRWAYPTIGTNATQFPDGFSYLISVSVDGNGTNLNTKKTITNAGIVTGKGYIRMTQDYISTTALWSPIDALVFTTALLPVKNEEQAPPNALGSYNVGNSAGTSKSAFQPIISDVALDLSQNPAGYRKQIYYEPLAEFRMSDFQNSKAEIRNIDINVFWRSRLDNQLYPVSLFNLASVSIKLMFRKNTDTSHRFGGLGGY